MERHKDATSSRFGLDAEGTEVNSLLWTPKAFAIAVFTVKRSRYERQRSTLEYERQIIAVGRRRALGEPTQ